MTDEETKEFVAAVRAAELEYNADIFFYSGGIDEHGLGLLVESVTNSTQHEKAVLILATNGGQANAGTRSRG